MQNTTLSDQRPRVRAGVRSIRRRFRGAVSAAWIGIAAAALWLAAGSLKAQSAISQEFQVKAVFLSKFASFVTWPPTAFPDTTAPITIGIWGSDPFGSHLNEAIAGEVINGRKIEILRVQNDAEAARCQVLFLRESESSRLASIVSALKGKPVLTVGETSQFTRRGGMMNFVVTEGRVRLEINPDEANRAGLKINSKLLSVATIVK